MFTAVDDSSVTMQSSKANKGEARRSLLTGVRYEHMLAGVTGGVTSTLVLHPLDLLKVRFAGQFGYNLNYDLGTSEVCHHFLK